MKGLSLPEKKVYKGRGDRLLLIGLILLLTFGVVMVYDVSAVYAQDLFGGKYYFLFLQAVWVLIGVATFLLISSIDYQKLKPFIPILFIFSLMSLVFVLIPTPFAPIIYGARRWILLNPQPFPLIPLLGRFSFQPSEFLKLSLTLYLALFLAKRSEKNFFQFIIIMIVMVGLVMKEPDFGTAILVSGIALIMFFASGANLFYFVLGLPALALFLLTLIFTSSYRRERLMTYLSPENSNLQGAGYHINQILIALGSGGLTGIGLAQSRQKYYIPEVATDSIIAVIGEEVGFIGLVLVIALFLLIINRCFAIAKKAPDPFGRLLAVGISSWFALQCFINLASMVHLIPLTGVPLPLLSYGGSSMLFGLAGLGIIFNISKSCKDL